MRDLLEGRNQVLLEVRMIQLAHSSTPQHRVQPPQSISASTFMQRNNPPERKPEPGAADHLSGLASPSDTLAILGILLASGQVSVPCSPTALQRLAAA